jgi:tetratricopeptide (TPR) repeat protein
MNLAAAVSSVRLRTWHLAALLVLIVGVSYGPAWRAGFIWDDDNYVTGNPLLTAPDGLQRIWFSTDSPSQYFPLTYTTFRAEHALWGLDPTGYHAFNILLHAVNGLLLWSLLRRLRVPGSWLAAVLFAIHPVQVETVAWVTELKNVQCLFFSLLAVHAWLRYTAEPAAEPDARLAGLGWYGLALVCHALALFSKTTACTLPAALLLILWWQHRPIGRRRLLEMVPFVALGVAMGVVSIWWEHHHQGTTGQTYALPWLDRVLVASRALAFYLRTLLCPADLCFNYPLWRIDAGAPLAWVWPAALVVAALVVWRLRRRCGRGLETAVVFHAATLSPLLGFVMLYTFCYSYVADHYQYVAAIGPLALLAAAIASLRAKPTARVAAAAALVIGWGALTWRQCGMFRDLETLWRTTLERNPNSSMAHNNLGVILLQRGDPEAALPHLTQALALRPGHPNTLHNLGRAYRQLGRLDEAIAMLQQALAAEPLDPKGENELALALLQRGRPAEAEHAARRALAQWPTYAEAFVNLGAALTALERPADAIDAFRRATALAPESADGWYNLGTALLQEGDAAAAAPALARAVQLRPGAVEPHHNLGHAELAIGHVDAAIDQFNEALQRAPNDAGVRATLAWTLLRAGHAEQAIGHFEALCLAAPESLEFRTALAGSLLQAGRVGEAVTRFEALVASEPGNADLRNNLGWALLQAQRIPAAIEQFQRAAQLAPDAPAVHGNLALAYIRQGQGRAAIAEYRIVLDRLGDDPRALCGLAWLLATWPEPDVRNGAQALALVRRANELCGGRDPVVLRTLAAAYAETGAFAEAVQAAERALQLPATASDTALHGTLLNQLASYRVGRPVRDGAGAPPS